MRVCIIISGLNKSIAFKWIANSFQKNNFRLHFVLLNTTPGKLYEDLINEGVTIEFIKLESKKDYPIAFYRLIRSLKKFNADIVHTHLRDADLLGLFSAKLLRVAQRITTRHSSTFNHMWYPRSVKWDRLINYLATDIIAISETVRRVLTQLEDVSEKKIHLIQHGFDLEAFHAVENQEIATVKHEHGIPENQTIVGVIARYIEWKGVQYIIQAAALLQAAGKNIHLVLANAHGPHRAAIEKELSKLKPNTFTEIAFESNLFALYSCFDIYVHTPIDDQIEAFGQTYVEALASGIPSVFTLSGIAHEFIEHERNALVVDYCNSQEIAEALLRLINDQELRERLILNGKQDVQQFNLSTFIDKLENLYLN